MGAFESADWSQAMAGVDVVVHLAARVHVMRETASDPLTEFRAVNVGVTEALARAAATYGVQRLVFVSSIKVNGEATSGVPYTPDDPPAPHDPYGVSKWEAEQTLKSIAEATGLEVVVIRPPLIYGAGVRGNFLRLLKLVSLGMPLPFGAVHNRRSMVYNGNLASALMACAFHPKASGKTYLVADGEDLSTAELVRRLAIASRKRAVLVSVPPRALRWMGTLAGREAEIERLVGSLEVDSNLLRSELGWTAPFSIDDGIAETSRWFAEGRSR